MLLNILLSLYSTECDVIDCAQSLTGSVGDDDSVSLTFINAVVQTVTFTNCRSDFDSELVLFDSAENEIQSHSTNGCDGDDCDDNWYCDDIHKETFTMINLEAGTYTLLLTPSSSGGKWTITVFCPVRRSSIAWALNPIMTSTLHTFPVPHVTSGTIITCNDDYQCANSTIDCGSDDCTIECSNNESCFNSTILCSSSCTVYCIADHSTCSQATIISPPSSTVSILCNAMYSCQGFTINIAPNSTLNLQCTEPQSCYYSNINIADNSIASLLCSWCEWSTLSIGNGSSLHLQCIENYRSCGNFTFSLGYGSSIDMTCNGPEACVPLSMHVPSDSTLNLLCRNDSACHMAEITSSSNTSLNITCAGDDNDHTCLGAVFSAGSDSSINVTCVLLWMHLLHLLDSDFNGDPGNYDYGNTPGFGVCSATLIEGASNSDINVTCDGYYSCLGATIKGQDAASLQLRSGLHGYPYSCSDIKIWCPQHVDGQPTCILHGTELGGRSTTFWPLTLYAINSWADIKFVTLDKTDDFYGTMHCTDGYNKWCDFGSANEWKCDDLNNACQTLKITSPTKVG